MGGERPGEHRPEEGNRDLAPNNQNDLMQEGGDDIIKTINLIQPPNGDLFNAIL